MIVKVISGGQTGVDQMALEVAKKLGVSTGGTMPKDFKTETGNRPDMAELYGMAESDKSDYPTRTKQNVRDSDLTVIFSTDADSDGTKCTTNACKELSNPYIHNPTALQIISLTNVLGEELILNVAGNRASRLKEHELARYKRVLTAYLMIINNLL